MKGFSDLKCDDDTMRANTGFYKVIVLDLKFQCFISVILRTSIKFN